MRWLVRCYLLVSAFGAVHSVRRARHARWAGVLLKGSPLQHALTIGTPLSAPPSMLIALSLAERSGSRRRVQMLVWGFLMGALGEPDTWTGLRHPGADPASTLCAIAEIGLPVAMLRSSPRAASFSPTWARSNSSTARFENMSGVGDGGLAST